jgi:hypothetical protein
VLGGSGIETGASDFDAVLGHFSTNGCTWMKRVELNGDGITEEVSGVVHLTGGGYAASVTVSGTPYSGFLLRVDENGSLVDCVRIDDPNGVFTSALVQLADGSFLVAGRNTSGAATLYKITAGGTLAWARSCASCLYNIINSFEMDAASELHGLTNSTIFEISPDGDACGFTDVSGVTLTPFTPEITDEAVVSVVPMTLFERPAVGGSTFACIGNGVEEVAPTTALQAFPVPTSNIVRLGPPGHVPWNERVEVRDLSGALLLDTPYKDGLDLGTFAPGAYVVSLPRTAQRTVVLRR